MRTVLEYSCVCSSITDAQISVSVCVCEARGAPPAVRMPAQASGNNASSSSAMRRALWPYDPGAPFTVAGHASRKTESIAAARSGSGASTAVSWKPVLPRRARKPAESLYAWRVGTSASRQSDVPR